MKVCLLNSFYEPDILGGAEISVKILAEKLNELGIETFVVSTGDVDKVEYINKVKVYRVNIGSNITAKKYVTNDYNGRLKKLKYKLLEIKNPIVKIKLQRIFHQERPDIIHVNNIYGISTEVWNVSNKMNIKVLQTLRDYFLICPKSTLSCNEKCECSMICKIYRKTFNSLTKKIDYVTAPSKYVIDEFTSRGYFKDIENECVYNAIDIDIEKLESTYVKKISKEINEINFIYLGALSEHKGLLELIKSFKLIEHNNIRLHIAGKGQLEEFVRKASQEDNRIQYHGFIQGEKLERLLMGSDILVAPSLWNEPFGRIVLDAYKFAMPVIVSNKGGLPEIVEHKNTGIVLEEVTVESIKNALTYFIDNKEIIKLMLNNTQKKILNFTIEKQVKEFIKIYEYLL